MAGGAVAVVVQYYRVHGVIAVETFEAELTETLAKLILIETYRTSHRLMATHSTIVTYITQMLTYILPFTFIYLYIMQLNGSYAGH